MASSYGLDLVPNCTACRLRSDCFFCSLPLSSLRVLDKVKVSNLLPAGSTLFVAGERPAGLHLLCQGRVGLFMDTARGRKILLKVVGPGEVLGLHSCIGRTVHEHSAETMQPCQVAFVPAGPFLRLLSSRPGVRWRTAQVLGKNCYSAHELVRTIGLRHTAGERIARLLFELATSAKPANGAAQPIEVPLHQQQIAESMGMSRVTVRRILAAYREAQIATLEGNTLIVHDPEILRGIAQHRNGSAGSHPYALQSDGFWGRLHPLRAGGNHFRHRG